MTQINVFDVAKYILDTIGSDISSMKLQKLCYYSQAWHMVWEKEPMFNEEFRRWENGPVCTELFHAHKGMFLVNSAIISENLLSGNELSDQQKTSVDSICENYGELSGTQLSHITHQEQPWLVTPKDMVIPKDLMKEYYSNL